MAQLLSIVAFSMVMPFMPFYIRALGVRDEKQVAMWAGLTISVSGLMFAVFAPVWGTLSDRYGRKIMVERSMFGGCVVLTLMGMVHSVHQLVIMRALQGMLTGTIAASTTLVSSIVPRDRLASSLGLLQTAVLTGSCLGPWIGGYLADELGYRVPFYIAGFLLLCAGTATLLFVHENFTPRPRGASRRHGLRKSFGYLGLMAILSVFFFLSFSASFVAPIFPLFVEKIAVGHRPASVTGLLIGLTGIAAGLSAMVIGRLSDRLGHKRMLVCTTLASGLLVLPVAAVRTLPQLFSLRIAAGLAGGGTSPAINAIIGTSVPNEIYGRAYGFAQSASALGMACGPLVGAMLSTYLGLRWPFAIMGLLLVMCAGLVAAFIQPNGTGNGLAASDQPSGTT